MDRHNPHKWRIDDDLLEQVLMEGVNKPKQAMFNQLMGSRFIRELMRYFPVQEMKRK